MVCCLQGEYQSVSVPDSAYYTQSKRVQIPLRKIDVSASVYDNFEQTIITHNYHNEHDKPITQTKYNFTLDKDCVITGLSAQFGTGTILHGVFSKKSTAKNTYSAAKETGKKTQLLEMNHDGSYTILIGNLDIAETLIISIAYIKILKTNSNGLLFVLPTNIAPKYPNFVSPPTYSQTNYSDKDPLEFNARISVKSSTKLNKISATIPGSIPYELIPVSENEMVVNVNSFAAVGDISVRIDCDQSAMPSVYQFTDPQYTYYGIKKSVPNIRIDREACEYIIFTDRSGSMAGAKMQNVKDALKILLNSFSAGTYFNIVSFGSHYESMFSQSVEYTNENKATALHKINAFEANLGGTELAKSFGELLTKSLPESVSERIIIILTDGQITDKDSLINVCSKITEKSKTRIFGIGVGDDADRETLATISNHTNGYYEMISDNGIRTCVINCLDMVNSERIKLENVSYTQAHAQVGGQLELFKSENRESYYANQQIICFARILNEHVPDQLNFNFTSKSQGSFTNTIDSLNFSTLDDRLTKLFANSFATNPTNIEAAEQMSVSIGIVNKLSSLVLVDQNSQVDVSNIEVVVPHYAESAQMQRSVVKMSNARSCGVNTIGSSHKNATHDIKSIPLGLQSKGMSTPWTQAQSTHESMPMMSRQPPPHKDDSSDEDISWYDNTQSFSSSKSTGTSKDTIFDLQNIDGSFQLDDPYILTLIGKTEQDLAQLIIEQGLTSEQAMYKLLIEFLSKDESYRFMLEKTTNYAQANNFC